MLKLLRIFLKDRQDPVSVFLRDSEVTAAVHSLTEAVRYANVVTFTFQSPPSEITIVGNQVQLWKVSDDPRSVPFRALDRDFIVNKPETSPSAPSVQPGQH